MVAVLPESTFAVFPLIVLLTDSSDNKLHGFWDGICMAAIGDDQMDMVAGGHMVENRQAISLARFKQ